MAFHTGAREMQRRAQAVRATLLVGAVATVVLAPTGLVTTRLAARLMGASGPVEDLAAAYLAIINVSHRRVHPASSSVLAVPPPPPPIHGPADRKYQARARPGER